MKHGVVKDKSVLKTELLLHNRKLLYLLYGMVLYLMTLTDLQTRRAGLSASAELLVTLYYMLLSNRLCLSNSGSHKSKFSLRRFMCFIHSVRRHCWLKGIATVFIVRHKYRVFAVATCLDVCHTPVLCLNG